MWAVHSSGEGTHYCSVLQCARYYQIWLCVSECVVWFVVVVAIGWDRLGTVYRLWVTTPQLLQRLHCNAVVAGKSDAEVTTGAEKADRQTRERQETGKYC